MPTYIELTDKEFEYCKELAETAASYKRRNGVPSQKKDTHHSDDTLNLGWTTSEFAVAKFLGLPYEIDTHKLDGDEYDLFYHDCRIEIKFIWYNSERLFKVATNKLHKNWEIGVLVRHIYGFKKWELVGYVGRNKFDAYGEIIHFPKGDMKCIKACDMEKGEFLVNI